MQTKELELPGCPFCGKRPVRLPRHPEIDGDAWTQIRCNNDRCPVKPATVDLMTGWNDANKRIRSLLAERDTLAAHLVGAREALEPFAAVWEYDDVGRHFPDAVYVRNGVRLNLMNDDMRRAHEALSMSILRGDKTSEANDQ